MRGVRALWRAARRAPLVGTALAGVDRLWWARTIRRADIVDLDVVAAQVGRAVSARRAVRTYVRGGFRHGFVINPLMMERTVSRQLSDADRVPALYAYLVNDRARLQTSPHWDSVAVASAHPSSLDDPAGPLGWMWRRARAAGTIDLGPARESVTRAWTEVVAAASRAADDPVPAAPTALHLTCVVAADEPDPDRALVVAAHAASGLGASVDLVVTGRSADLHLQARLLALWVPGISVRRASLDEVAEPVPLPDGSAGLWRAAGADLDAATLEALAAAGAEHPVAALWIGADGTITAAGAVVHERRTLPLLEGHPAEDARRLGAEVAVPILTGPARAWPAGAVPSGPGRVLTESSVMAPGRMTGEVSSIADTDLDELLAPSGLVVAAWKDGRPLLGRADGAAQRGLRWAIKTSSPAGRAGESWGDTHFARGIATALERLGQEAAVDARAAAHRPSAYLDDVALVLRGPHRIDPPPAKIRILWIISHPDEITPDELEQFDVVFAASAAWAERATERFDRTIRPLLQCTDTTRFRPSGAPRTDDIVFVGTARGIARPAVVEPLKHGIPVRVYGPDWSGYIPGSAIAATGIPNEDLPQQYETAAVVLNDHWPAMRREGFVSNRLFDVVAAGGRAISDQVDGIDDIFHGAVRTFDSTAELIGMLSGDIDSLFPDDASLSRLGAEIRSAHSFDRRAAQLLSAAEPAAQRDHRRE
ncbi:MULTISPECIES: glycosyltransferase [Microbacterium]|uniref:glycosyltransferase family protein n=1 Tax=Microbacterium TaxID=33882 RepID=UPI000D6514AD|nr:MULTISPECIES: glycosyltransferase [Microbacterium]